MADEKKKPAPAAKKEAEPARPVPPARMRVKYDKDVVPALMTKLKLTNKMAVPKLVKICINMGLGKAAADNQPKIIEQCLNDLTTIAGQKAVLTKTKKSISNFKLRAGMTVGARVTLRGARMYEFFDRLVTVAIPRIRDFRGVSPRSFDGRGNYSMGLQEQSVFPEIEGDKIDHVHGMDITICTTARDNDSARELLRAMGFPFRER